LELALQLRPKVLRRMWFNHDPDYRHAMRWYTGVGRRVWFHEVADFVRHLPRYVRPAPPSRTLKNFLGSSLAVREYVLNRKKS
jgi:anaerobic magnesium-protoporphyrin IX monomethyl ester cyclase